MSHNIPTNIGGMETSPGPLASCEENANAAQPTTMCSTASLADELLCDSDLDTCSIKSKLLPYKGGCGKKRRRKRKKRACGRKPRRRKSRRRRCGNRKRRRRPSRRRACKKARRRRRPKKKCLKGGPITNNGYLNFLRFFRKCNCHLTAKQAIVKGAQKWNCLTKAQKDYFRRQACKMTKNPKTRRSAVCRKAKKRRSCKPKRRKTNRCKPKRRKPKKRRC